MDFLSSYLPSSPALFTPRSARVASDDFSQPHAPSDEQPFPPPQHFEFNDLRQTRKEVQKRRTTVRFISPLTDAEDTLTPIKLTPRVPSQNVFEETGVDDNQRRCPSGNANDSPHSSPDKSSSHISFFGFKFRKAHQQ